MAKNVHFSFKQELELIKKSVDIIINYVEEKKKQFRNTASLPGKIDVYVNLKNILENISKCSAEELNQLDDISVYTLNEEGVNLKEAFVKLSSSLQPAIDDLVYYMAKISQEVTWRLYATTQMIQINFQFSSRIYPMLMFKESFFKWEPDFGNESIKFQFENKKLIIKHYCEKIMFLEMNDAKSVLKQFNETQYPEMIKVHQHNEELINKGEKAASDIKEENLKWSKLLESNIKKIGARFSVLLKEKKFVKRWCFASLILLSVIMLVFPGFLLIELNKFWHDIDFSQQDWRNHLWILGSRSFPLIAIELIFVFLFKILLEKYGNLTGETVQTENRVSLSEFIIPYAEYIRTHDPSHVISTLNKFNEIIFKPIVVESKDIPKLIGSVPELINPLNSLVSNGNKPK